MSLRDNLCEAIPRLRLFARSIQFDHAKADDLVSRAYTKILEKESELEPNLNVVAYGITIIKNLTIDDAKSAFSDHDSLDEKYDTGGFEPPSRVSDEPESKTLLDDVMAVLKTMSQDCQDILSRLAIGLSYEEISSDLGWEKNTVGVRALRCRKTFAELGADLL